MAGCRASESACTAAEAAAAAAAAVESMPRVKLSERFTGGLRVQITSEVTGVKDEIQEWIGVFHNHSAIYTKYKNVCTKTTSIQKVCTKTTSTLQRRHVQHLKGSVTNPPFL
jgi:hypothetical protein